MTIDRAVEAEIRRLHYAEHWKKGTIVAQLGVHSDVVDRVIQRPGPRPKSAIALVPGVLEPYAGFIDETLKTYPKLVGTRVFDMVCERGYRGSLRTLRRYLRRVRPMPKHEVFLRLTALVGEQAQVDWGHVGRLVINGRERGLWVFVMVLAYSRAIFAELVLDLTVHSLRRSLVRGSVYFGGSPRQWLFDNPKIVVVERHGDAVRFHPLLLDLAGQLCVQPRLCGVRKPHEKGAVERAIRYLKERFFAARSIISVEEGNTALRAFLTEVTDQREHPRWPERKVFEVLAEERAHLLALPRPLPDTDLVTPVTADKTAFIHFDGNVYSVPSDCARGVLTLVADDTHVQLLRDKHVVADHRRSWGRRERIEDPGHREALLEQKAAAKALKGRDRLAAEVPGIQALFVRWIDAGRNAGAMTARTIRLLNLYGAEVLRHAVTEATTRGSHDPGALAVLCERARIDADQPLPNIVDMGPHIPDRDVIPHDLGGYDGD